MKLIKIAVALGAVFLAERAYADQYSDVADSIRKSCEAGVVLSNVVVNGVRYDCSGKTMLVNGKPSPSPRELVEKK